jgi:hypothetical protein
MNFLWIILVLQLFLYSKSISKSIFSVLFNSWTGPQIQRNLGVSAQDSLDTENTVVEPRVDSQKGRGLLCNCDATEGVLVNSGRWIQP